MLTLVVVVRRRENEELHTARTHTRHTRHTRPASLSDRFLTVLQGLLVWLSGFWAGEGRLGVA